MESENHRYHVLVADDHDIVCAGVKSLLKKCPKIEHVDAATNYHQMMQQIEAYQYEILILDLNYGDHSGIAIIRELTDSYPQMKILVLSMYPEDPYAIQCIHEGAKGYVHKAKVLDELVLACKKIIAGEVFISPEYEKNLFYGTELTKQEQSPLSLLTSREFEIYNLIVSGVSFKEIAHKLCISPKTVSAHHANILHKLELSNTNQLIHFALQHQ